MGPDRTRDQRDISGLGRSDAVRQPLRHVVDPAGVDAEQRTGAHHRRRWPTQLLGRRTRRAAGAAPGFPAAAALTRLAQPAEGHADPRFTAAMSYMWGTVRLIHAVNESAGAPTYVCGDLRAPRLLSGAIAYDGQRTPDAPARYDEAWEALGLVDVPAAPSARRPAVARATADVAERAAGALQVTNAKLVDFQAAIAALPREDATANSPAKSRRTAAISRTCRGLPR